MRILIADDDITSRTVLAAVLKKNGHEVIEARDGGEALASLERDDAPRLAILDWMMPRMDGLEVCRRVLARLRERPPYMILLTTRDSTADLSNGLRAGANDYLTKPFNAPELIARLEVGRRFVALEDRFAAKVRELETAIAQIKTLGGIVPICSHCRRIRDDAGYWSQVEAYLAAHSEVLFSHGLCPECLTKHYPEYAEDGNAPDAPGKPPPPAADEGASDRESQP